MRIKGPSLTCFGASKSTDSLQGSECREGSEHAGEQEGGRPAVPMACWGQGKGPQDIPLILSASSPT